MPSRLKHDHTDVKGAAPALPSPAVQRKVLQALYGDDPTQKESLFFSISSLISPPPNLYFFFGPMYTFQLVSSCGSHFPLLGGELMRFSITSQRKGEGESNLTETDEVMPLLCHITAHAHGAMMQTSLPLNPGREACLRSPRLKLFTLRRAKMLR